MVDSNLAQPPDIAPDEDSDGKRTGDDREEKKHGLARGRFERGHRHGLMKISLAKITECEACGSSADQK